jgi:hypothetical protein
MTRVETSAGQRVQPMGSVTRYETRIGEMALAHARVPA